MGPQRKTFALTMHISSLLVAISFALGTVFLVEYGLNKLRTYRLFKKQYSFE